MMKNLFLEDALIYSAVRAIGAFVCLLPERAALGLAKTAGELFARVAGRRSVALKNVTTVFPDKTGAERRRIVRQNFGNLFMNAVELLRVTKVDNAYFLKNLTVEGEEKLRKAIDAGKGVLLVTAHFGNWEMMPMAAGVRRIPISAFARAQKHPRSDAYLNSLRASKGAQIVYKGVSARAVLAALKTGRVVGMLADQDAGRNGIFLDFCGRASSWPRGVARFARIAGVPIMPVFDIRLSNSGRHRIVCRDEIVMNPALGEEAAEAAAMRTFADLLEREIRLHPDQWLWAHKRWKSSPRRNVLVISDKKMGHAKQSAAFCQALRAVRESRNIQRSDTVVQIEEIEYRSKFLKSALIVLGIVTGGRFPMRRALLEAALGKKKADELESAAPDFIVSCGSGTEAVNLILSSEFGSKSCAIQKPPFGLGRFDVVVAPKHDTLPDARNIFRVDGAVAWLKNGSAPVAPDAAGIGFLIGGPTRRVFWEPDFADAASRAVRSAAEAVEGSVYASSSRRTPKEAEESLRRVFGSWERCRSLVLVHQANPAGAYDQILAKSRVIVATADSVSMISEALGAKRRVVALVPKRSTDKKLGAFLNRLDAEGRLRLSGVTDLERVIAEELAKPDGPSAPGGDGETLVAAAEKLLGEKILR